MTLEQLRIFVAVAERQHVTQAAAALNLTQSAVSSALSALEARHDVKLFDRVGRAVVLNQVGEAFLKEARAVLARAAEAETALADFGGLKRGRLTVGASQTIASYWLPQRLAAFRAAWPGVSVSVEIANTAGVAEAVLAGAAELGFVEGDVEEGMLSRRRIGADKLVVVVGRGHPWAGRRTFDAAEALSTDWVLREQGSGTRSVFEVALKNAGVAPASLAVTLTLPGNEAVLTAVEAGAGATAISASAASAGLRSGALHALAFDLPDRPYWLIRHKARYRSKAGETFLKIAETETGT